MAERDKGRGYEGACAENPVCTSDKIRNWVNYMTSFKQENFSPINIPQEDHGKSDLTKEKQDIRDVL